MASPQQTSFTVFPLPPKATNHWFWRKCRGTTKQKSEMLGVSRRIRRLWAVVLLGILTLLLTLVPVPSLAQSSAKTAPVSNTAEAAVVLDGQVLFQVKNSGNFTAAERAQIINKALEDEVRENKPVDIEVVQEKDTLNIRSQNSDRILVTMTEADVLPGSTLTKQAREWERLITVALKQSQLERDPRYYRQSLLLSIGVLLATIAIHAILHFFGKFLSRQITRWLGDHTLAPNPQARSAKLFVQLALLGFQVGLWIAVAFFITDILPDARSWRYKLFRFLTSPVLTLGEVNYSALQVLQLIALTVGLWFAVSFLTRLFKSYVLVRTGAEAGVQEVIAVITQYTLAFLGMIVLLQTSGLDLRSLAIFASVIGVGIGFGVQNIANNLISGLIITLERPIKLGDFVKVGDLMGTVKRIGARSTEIQTLDQVSILVPNSRFLESEVVNWSYGDPVSRLLIPVGVAYGSNIQHVQAALLEAARSHPEVLVRPHPQVWFLGMGESSLDFDLRVWVGDPKKLLRIKSDLYYRIEASLRRYNVEVPFPQRDLNLRSPQIEQFINVWLQQHGSNAQATQDVPLATLYSANGDKPSDNSQESPTLTSGVPMSEQALLTAASKEKLASIDIESLVRAMQEPGGVEIKDRHHHMNLYPRCFVGSQAVEWLMQKQNCTREDAIQLGQLLVDRGIIHHVSDEQPFRDSYIFYRFYAEEQGAINS